MIALEDIVVRFSVGTPLETTALPGLSLTIAERGFVTVIGANGAGKSTMLGVIAGETPISAGRLRIDGEDMTATPTHRRAAKIARVFQDPRIGVCGAMTIEENFVLALSRGARRGLGRALTPARRAMFRDRAASLGLGLENRLSERIGLLSGGQRQALSLLMATFAESRLLLLDEHTAALDPKMADVVIDLTRRLVAEHRLTTLMVTHSMANALSCGDRTVMLREGRVRRDFTGADRATLTPAALRDLFAAADDDDISGCGR